MVKHHWLVSASRAAAVLAFATSGAAYGQTAQPAIETGAANPTPTPAVEAEQADVVVTGIRRSLENAVDTKRRADSIVDAISAEDIGAFPDQNIAESLQRITGVQITRSKGEGSQATIRGLDPKFTAVLLNGQTLSSVRGQSLSGTGTSRSFDFTILSSDFVSSLEVYKSPTADLPDGGVAGTLNIKTLRPLELAKRRLAVNVEGIYEQYSDKLGPHASALYADKFFDNRLGVVVGVDYSKRYVSTERYDGGGMDKRREGASPISFDWNRDGDLNDYYRFSHINAFGIDYGDRERRSAIAGVQFQATDTVDIWYNFLGSQFKNNLAFAQQSLQVHIPVQAVGNPSPTLVGSSISPVAIFPNDLGNGSIGALQLGTGGQAIRQPDGVLVAGVVDMMDFNNGVLVNNTRTTFNDTKTFSHSFGGTFDDDDHWVVDFRGSLSRTRDVYTALSLEASAAANLMVDLRTDPGGIPTWTFQRGFDPLDPANFKVTSINGSLLQAITDKNKEGQVDFTYKVHGGFLKGIQFGVKVAERENVQGNQNLNIGAGAVANMLGVAGVSPTATSFSAANFMQLTGGDDYLSRYDGPSTFNRTFLASNTLLFLDQYSPRQLAGLNGTTVAGIAFPTTGTVSGIATPVTTNLTQTGRVAETLWAGYVRANFGTGEDRLTGNVGVRAVLTDQHSFGYQPDFTGVTFNPNGAQTVVPPAGLTRISRSYTDILPSLNLKYQATDQVVVRFAAAKTMARPDLGSLVPRATASGVTQSISDTNPYLEPFRAKQLDLSFEWYPGRDSLLSAALFYKDVEGYTVTEADTLTIPVRNVVTNVTTDVAFNRTRPVNGGSGKIKGLELNVQQAFSFLPGILSGFGVQANYTYIDADKIPQTVAGVTTPVLLPVPGVSRHSFNLVGYYEKGPVSLRAAYNYRSAYTEDAVASRQDGIYVDPIGQLDASLKIALTSNFSLTLDGTNLTDEPIVRTNQYGYNRGWEVNGRRITFGARAAF